MARANDKTHDGPLMVDGLREGDVERVIWELMVGDKCSRAELVLWLSSRQKARVTWRLLGVAVKPLCCICVRAYQPVYYLCINISQFALARATVGYQCAMFLFFHGRVECILFRAG